MIPPRLILVAGIGNMRFGDEAFGSEVARRLKHHHAWPDHVRVEDFGTRSYDLACALMEAESAVLIESVARGEPPGTISLIEPTLEKPGAATSHGPTMNIARVLQMIPTLGGKTGRLFLVGCEPGLLESADGQHGLSAPVQAALPDAIALVERVVADLIYNKNPIHLRIRDGAVKVALAHGAVSGHDDPRPVHDHP